MNMLKDWHKKITTGSYAEYAMTCALGVLLVIQRFLAGGYKPVMDDWFLYGDLYTNISERLSSFAFPNEKFAIRPIAGFFDCFVNAPLFNHLWIVELALTLSLLAGAFFIMKTMRRNNAGGAGFLMCLVCLFPVGLEATYWIAAATRISYSVLFTGAAVFALDWYYKTRQKRGIVLYAVLGMICVGFYEPPIVLYILLTLFVIQSNYKNKKDLMPLIITAAHIAVIGLYYVLNSGSGEIESRGGFLESGIIEHTSVVTGYIYDIFVKYSKALTGNGWRKGLLIVMGGHKIIKTLLIGVFSLLFGVFSAICIKKRKFSIKIFVFGIIMFLGGLCLNYVLGSDRITLRLVYFSYFGAGIMLDELLMLLPNKASKTLCAVIMTCLAFVFTVSGIGEVSDYRQTSDFDVYITQQIVDMDEEHVTDVDKNTYVFGGQHYYEETWCISYLDHIRGVSGNYADITGCMRHLTNVAFTNNIMTFTYGDTQALKPFIDTEGLCKFYNIEYDKTVVEVSLEPDGDNYNIVRPDGTVAGTLQMTDDTHYQYIN
ncbi:MAG: glucosyltransferase domain-containing protein [Oscillospiraceae bacterium]|nr:glucosyltransferase domain-containing protein [Oscillospiraceae bacterium]